MTGKIVFGKILPYRTLQEALQLQTTAKPRIAAVGAGGKTTTLKKLAAEYKIRGQYPIVTTTTHILKEDLPYFAVEPSLEQIQAVLKKEGWLFTGNNAGNGRLNMPSDEIFNALLELENPILLEADGARRLPVKFPAAHEPVLLPQVTCVLSVYGIEAVGKRIQETAFRPGLLAAFLQKQPFDRLQPRDIARLAQSPEAGRKGTTADMQYIVVLNQADTPEKRKTAIDIWKAMDHPEKEQVIVTSYEQK